jgi:hypothetical protein
VTVQIENKNLRAFFRKAQKKDLKKLNHLKRSKRFQNHISRLHNTNKKEKENHRKVGRMLLSPLL